MKCSRPDARRSRSSQETLQEEILEIAPPVDDGEHGHRIRLDPIHDAIGPHDEFAPGTHSELRELRNYPTPSGVRLKCGRTLLEVV